MDFLGIGPLEIVIILILGFLFFGPEKLPGMAAKAGKLYRNFRKATFDLTRTITNEVSTDSKDLREELTSIGKSLTEDITGPKDTGHMPLSTKMPEPDRQLTEESAGNKAPAAKSGKKETTPGETDNKTTEPDADEYMI